LRYFNAAGADDTGDIGEAHHPETHLIPLVLQAALGQRNQIFVYGNDYDTKDGTCIRDYIHVNDLADAHILALEKLLTDDGNFTYNLGSGLGYSVQEVIEYCREITGYPIMAVYAPRREGDVPVLLADSNCIRQELGWQPRYNLQQIVETAWRWHKQHPNGYRSAV
jgi:UDP-glucose 4-epimerase